MGMKMKLSKLNFGTAGTPLICKDRSSLAGVEAVAKLGLSAMELEFVHGVRMSIALAKQVGTAAAAKEVILTAHAPYYINLNSAEMQKVKDSANRILETARVAGAAGAYSITFHPAYFQGGDPVVVFGKVREQIKSIVKTLKDEEVGLWIRPETTGKESQLGSLRETIKLAQDIEQVLPCVDFAHLHARTGKQNSYAEFCDILSELEKGIGRQVLDNMHIHMSGIEYTAKGERKHLPLEESDFKYKELMKAFKDYKLKGVVICESPIIEEDALLMKKTYESL